ncbi:MAG TPA: alpha-amylase family protein, partial [Acidimicrobiales bacterium]|nr:alpha-amylase family protein [Acidimicrobiales bacterium]
YPTKVGVMHPHLSFDLLGRMIEACHRASIKTPVYTSIMWDMRCAELNAGWRCLDQQGRQIGASPLQAGWLFMCPNSPYGDYVVAQAEEVAKNYEADGFWFDIMVIPPGGCFCPYCMAERERLGLDSTKLEDRNRQFEMVLTRTMERLTAAVRPHRPSALVYFNGRLRIGPPFRKELKYFTHLEIESLPGGHWGYGYFALMARYSRNLGLDYLGMTARFHRSWGDFGTIRNQAALDFECFRMLANAGKCSIGDQLHPRGRLVKAVYERIGKTYASVKRKEPWCRGAKAVTEIGSLSQVSYLDSGFMSDADLGVTRMLGQLHEQFDILDRDSDFSRYRLLILPDDQRLDDALLAKVRGYLASGGKLLLSHQSGLDPEGGSFVLEEAGIEYLGPSPYQGNKGDYFKAGDGVSRDVPDMVHFTYGAGSVVRVRAGAQGRAQIWKPYFDRTYEHFSSHAQTAWDQPVDQAAVVENGGVSYISFPVFQNYAQNGYAPHKALVENCIRRLMPDPCVRVQAPSTAEVTLTEQPGRMIVHVLHYPAERRGVDLDIVEDVIPLFNVPLALRLPRAPAQVYTAPDMRPLQVAYQNGYASVTVPSVFGHAMVVFEA